LPDFSGLVDSNGPAVVNISAITLVREEDRAALADQMPDDENHRRRPNFLDRFFGAGDPEPITEAVSSGSGFVISPDGYLITNFHVVSGATEIRVRFNDRSELLARVVGADPPTDIALLKVDGKGLPTVSIGSSRDTAVGEWVVAIGSPFNFEHSVTAGIVSAKGRSFVNQQYVPFLQTDVPINRGNSGGPLINMDGKVIGINSQIYTENGAYMGLSFAIPVEIAMAVVEQLKMGHPVNRGLLGVGIEDVSKELANAIGLETPRGAIVTVVEPGSAAAKAGVRVWDVILAFNGQRIERFSDLPPLVGLTAPGASAQVEVFRNGTTRKLTAQIGEQQREPTLETPEPHSPQPAMDRFGLEFAEAGTDDQGAPGLRVTAVKGWEAQRAGFRKGDVILMVDAQAVTDINDLDRLLDGKANRSVAFLVQRRFASTFLVIRANGTAGH
jgi:serine protease Do